MASSNVTENLQLNQWQGADKPKMADFNSDNQKIDEAIGFIKGKGLPVIGSYTGDGNNTQEIELGFRPSFGIVFAIDQAIVRVQASNVVLFTAFIGPNGSTLGVDLTDTGFSAVYLPQSMGGRMTYMNAADIIYQYIVFR